LDSTLLKGASQFPKLLRSAYDIPEPSSNKELFSYTSEHKEHKHPILDCPRFNGEHPRVWKEKCEKNFTLFKVPLHIWAPYASINVGDNPALWLQSYET
jgi:hypothetical protein